MKIALIIIGILAVLFILLLAYALCAVSKYADIMEKVINETHEEL